MGDASSRLLIYSMDKLPFEEESALLITVRADDALAVESQITMSNIVLADASNTGWHVADCAARVTNTSGIEDLTANNDRLWVEGRTLCIECRNDGRAQVVAVNGTVSTCRLEPGTNRQTLDAGFYVVVLNGKSYKIAIK